MKIKLKTKKFLYLLLVLTPAFAAADTFDDIAGAVAARNPMLRAEAAAAGADASSRIAANRLEAAEVGFNYKWPSHKAAGAKLGFEVSQPFDWPAVYGARRRAAARAAAAADLRLQAVGNQVDKQIRTTLCDIVDANKRIVLLQFIVSNLDTLHSRMHVMLDQGQTTELDHRKLAIEEVAMKQQLADAQTARTAALAALSALNGDELPAGADTLSQYPPATLLPFETYAAMRAPAVEAAAIDADVRRLDVRTEKMGLLPGFSLGYALDYEAGELFQGFSVGLRLPQYSAKPAAEAARLEAESLALQAEAAEAERRSSLTATYREAEMVKKLLDDYDFAFGHDYPQLLARALNGGQISYADFFSELNFYLSARLEYLAQQQRYHRLLQTLTHP